MFHLDVDIGKYSKKIYSQNDEDGILLYLSEALSIHEGFFVEFGVGPPWNGSIEKDGLESNCRLLKEKGWRGLFMDGGKYPEAYDVKTEFITALNVNLLLRKYKCPAEIDLMSIDVDGQDFWIWMNLQTRPKIVIIEYNKDFDPDQSFVVPFDVNFRWDTTRYMGASLLAVCKLAKSKFYMPIYANGVNAFFVREELLSNSGDFSDRLDLPRSRLHKDDTQNRPWTRI